MTISSDTSIKTPHPFVLVCGRLLQAINREDSEQAYPKVKGTTGAIPHHGGAEARFGGRFLVWIIGNCLFVLGFYISLNKINRLHDGIF